MKHKMYLISYRIGYELFIKKKNQIGFDTNNSICMIIHNKEMTWEYGLGPNFLFSFQQMHVYLFTNTLHEKK